MKLMNKLTILGTALLLAGLASAQEKNDAKPQEKKDEKPAVRRPVSPPDRTAALSRYLNLSDEQKTKIKPILDEEYMQQRAVRDDKSMTPQQMSAKLKEIRESTTAKVKPLLHDDQVQKWERMRNPRPAGGGAVRPPAPGGAPAPAAPPAPSK
jgi:hypothetical protein